MCKIARKKSDLKCAKKERENMEIYQAIVLGIVQGLTELFNNEAADHWGFLQIDCANHFAAALTLQVALQGG